MYTQMTKPPVANLQHLRVDLIFVYQFVLVEGHDYCQLRLKLLTLSTKKSSIKSGLAIMASSWNLSVRYHMCTDNEF